ncbi:Uncharacterised protein [Vibrio cholerae]|uniref:Uncharacterized protein n=1 Tax=Vibrio cholerae TaxID=666 RepID=A0A655ZGW6_VIBCL|nr:Uncharacterised protein [Vibrio cholerae]CSA70811.1 Uncharacterised protein [Vibrio cholerae]CSB92655.1 Uncharacterised protein [Vibrio cholerae]CSC31363.1 Uncharacterised protein [Vibrio cholerae]CSC69232.1 Uncharacterised protein [Vibrio cholerae]
MLSATASTIRLSGPKNIRHIPAMLVNPYSRLGMLRLPLNTLSDKIPDRIAPARPAVGYMDMAKPASISE